MNARATIGTTHRKAGHSARPLASHRSRQRRAARARAIRYRHPRQGGAQWLMALGEIYIKLVVNFADNPKVRALARYGSDAGLARDLYVQMVCHCKELLTDGFVSAEQVGLLVYPLPPDHGNQLAKQLASVGLIKEESKDEAQGWQGCGCIAFRTDSRIAAVADLEAGEIRGGGGGRMRSGLVAPGALLRQARRFQDAVNLRLPVWHQGGDVLDEGAVLAFGDDGRDQLRPRLVELLLSARVAACRLQQAGAGLGAHEIHDATPLWQFQLLNHWCLRYLIPSRSPL